MRIRRGVCYLLENETSETAYRLFLRLLPEQEAGFCLSRMHPEKVRTRFGSANVRIGWLAEVPGEDHFSANAMASVAKAIQQFIQEHGSSGIVLIDGLEYVILHNGFQPTLLAFVEHLNEFTMGTQAIVLIAFRPQTLDPRELALLERNLQVLEGADVKSQLDIEELGEILGVDAPAEGTSTEKIEATKVLSPLPDMGGIQVERVRCPKCGTENDAEVAFCVYCGSLLPDHAGTPPAPTAPRPESFRRARPSSCGRRIPVPGVPHVAILASRDVRFARHLRLDGNPRDVPGHLHRGGPVLGPGSTTGPDRRSSADLETLSSTRRTNPPRLYRGLLRAGRAGMWALPREEYTDSHNRTTRCWPLFRHPPRCESRCSQSRIVRRPGPPMGRQAGA